MSEETVIGGPLDSRGSKAHGGSLYLDGCDVDLSREALVLDVRISKVDSSKLETIVVTIKGVEVASLPATFVLV